MYTVTFYSFKGGVGRTMALVNTALSLVQLGRRVMLIDFDLEAPGLTTFDRLRPDHERPGIVEYVVDYLKSGESPNVGDYVFEPVHSDLTPGRIWVLPAGREDILYRRSLAEINWPKLYQEKEGFLLFEDLKYQIQDQYNPDYLLIDSRTGHSDVEGICTRHLPDAVVVLFFPNEQNLCGLDTVCRNIRAEKDSGLNKDILLHFVMSNVPDLDDEDAILRKRMSEFRKRLHFRKLSATINHYNSLTLLNQSVFALDRPSSRLAKQYKRLLDEIVKGNLSDKSGALDYLRDLSMMDYTTQSMSRGASWLQDTETRIRDIASKFPSDSEVLFSVAKAFESFGDIQDAEQFLSRLLDHDSSHIAGRIERASFRATLGDVNGAVSDLMACLDNIKSDEGSVISAVRLLSSIDIEKFVQVVTFSAIRELSPNAKHFIADYVTKNPKSWINKRVLDSLIVLLEDVCQHSKDGRIVRSAKFDISLLLIYDGRFEEAMVYLNALMALEIGVAQTFNYAMARWGKDGSVSPQLMNRVNELVPEAEQRSNPNYFQCMAMVDWAVGDSHRALSNINHAELMSRNKGGNDFSCWRYAYVSQPDFVYDCKQIKEMIMGSGVMPDFITRNIHVEKVSEIDND